MAYRLFQVTWTPIDFPVPDANPMPSQIDYSGGYLPNCQVDLPYPAEGTGYFKAKCVQCGATALCQTTGLAPSTITLTVACQPTANGSAYLPD